MGSRLHGNLRAMNKQIQSRIDGARNMGHRNCLGTAEILERSQADGSSELERPYC